MVRVAVSIVLLLALAGCASRQLEPVFIIERVEVPVPVKREPPEWLAEPYRPQRLPEFVPPSDPAATSALTAEGEQALKLLLEGARTRDRAWRAWSAAD
jgi:hypothetical protein